MADGQCSCGVGLQAPKSASAVKAGVAVRSETVCATNESRAHRILCTIIVLQRRSVTTRMDARQEHGHGRGGIYGTRA